MLTNRSVPEVVIEIEYTSSVWDKLNTDSKTPHKTVYWLDKKTMLPVQAIMQNKEGEVLTVVEFLSIQTNPEFSNFPNCEWNFSCYYFNLMLHCYI